MASNTRVELREVRLSAKPEAMLAISPKGTVPVLLLPGGQIIDESIDIMHDVLGKNDPEGWLDRNDRALVDWNDGAFKHSLDRYKYPDRYGVDAQIHRRAALPFLEELDRRLSVDTYLCGGRRGMVDAAIMPFVRQFAGVDQPWFDTCPFPFLRAWLRNFLATGLFAAAMHRAQPWAPEDPTIYFPAFDQAQGGAR